MKYWLTCQCIIYFLTGRIGQRSILAHGEQSNKLTHYTAKNRYLKISHAVAEIFDEFQFHILNFFEEHCLQHPETENESISNIFLASILTAEHAPTNVDPISQSHNLNHTSLITVWWATGSPNVKPLFIHSDGHDPNLLLLFLQKRAMKIVAARCPIRLK